MLAMLLPMLVGAATTTTTTTTSSSTSSTSWVVPNVSVESVKAQLSNLHSDAIEGIWSTTADGSSVAIVPGTPQGEARTFAAGYLLVVLRSARVSVPTGTVMGWCTPTARRGSYDCYAFTQCDGTTLSHPQRFTLRLTDTAHLAMIQVHDGMEISAWRLLPYMFRRALRERHTREDDLDGLLRQWPVDTENPAMPRYL